MAHAICSIGGCDGTARKRGWCAAHYERWIRGRDMNAPLLRRNVPIMARLARHISVAESGCWEWTGTKTHDGYGLVRASGTNVTAHRAMFEEVVAPIPDGFEIDHLCRNRCCINPAHLESVTHTENIRRAAAWIRANRVKLPGDSGRPM